MLAIPVEELRPQRVRLAQPQGAISPPAYADAPMARLILYTHVEIVHHGAEICLLRDLHLWKGGRERL